MRPYARQYRNPVRMGLALLLGLAFLGFIDRSLGAALTVTVLSSDNHPLGGVVVTVHPTEGHARPAPPVEAIMDQINRAFAPDLLVIPVNSTVAFPNSDSVSHQIYSFSPTKRFQLPLYHGNPNPPVRFEQPGVVTLGCNIHDQMLAYVVVTDAPFFGRTDSHGSWSAEVPNGGYRVSIWHPRIRDAPEALQHDIKIGESNSDAVTIRLSKPLKPAPLEGQPHSWDSY